MNKKQSIFLKLNDPIYFLSFLMVAISITFIVFSPRVSSLVFPIKRDIVFDNFLEDTKKSNSINPQEFWKFREFYSPGYFELKDQGLDNSDIQAAIDEIGINPSNINSYTSLFRSKHSVSLDALTEELTLESVINLESLKNVTFKNENSIIFKNENGETFIIFLLPISEMKKANGFFEYEGKDKNLLENKKWFSITQIDR